MVGNYFIFDSINIIVMRFLAFVLFTLGSCLSSLAQSDFSKDPYSANFVTSDYDNFWEIFDNLEEAKGNPFELYLESASDGLRPMVQYIDVDALHNTVLNRKSDYIRSRPVISNINDKLKRVEASYAALEYWYPDAVFPPVYFAVGMFTVGGTISENGLLIGAEMLQNVDGLHGLVAHELIHFQQHISGSQNLLSQSITEGSADFIGELISGLHINLDAFAYGEEHENSLCSEFVQVMFSDDYEDWLYGTTGKDDRPNDLGYWIGYKITEAYFDKQQNKRAAISSILNISDTEDFMKASGYLDAYLLSKD